MENNSANTQQTPKTKKQLPAFVILGIIALIAAVALALTNMVTKGPIQERAAAALQEAFNAVMPAESYEQLSIPAGYSDVTALYAAKNGDEVIGYCVTASKNGYNAAVAVNLGVGTDGLVTGCSIGDTNFAETPGFGARAKEASFQDQFVGLDAVNGGSFDALTGATVTSTAVLNATNEALRCVDEAALGKTPAADPLVTFGAKAEAPAKTESKPLTGDVHQGSAKGFASDVTVELTLDDAGAIAQLTINAEGETAGLGQRTMEDDFTSQFVGKTGPFTLGDSIDAISGATISSQAAVDAVNSALSAPASAGAEVVEVTAKGFVSDVTVSLTVENGAIATFSVDASGETAGLGQRAMEDDFTSQFIGKSAPLTLGDGIDAISGATITSTAVVDAANDALSSMAGSAEAADPGVVVAQDDNTTVSVKNDGTASVSVNEGYTGTSTVTLNAENGKITTGSIGAAEAPKGEEMTATAKGFGGDVTVKATIDNGTITALTVETPDETAGLGQKCSDAEFTSQFIGKAIPVELGKDVDAVSGATITSAAVVDALNSLNTPDIGEIPEEEQKPVVTGEEKSATAQGFLGDVTVKATLDGNTITALTVETPDETPGLGQNCSEEDFTKQFIGKTLPVELGKDVDAVSGATITSTAVVDALNSLAAAPAEEATATEEPAAAVTGEEKSATAQGFLGDVTVKATLDGNTITALTVETPDETPGLGQNCSEEDFTKQFIGKTLPVELGKDVDAVSGATITSTAVVDALNSLAAAPAEEATATEEPAAAVTGEEKSATAQGFLGDVTVKATLDGNTITALTVETPDETPGLGQNCSEEDFTKQFIGKTLPVELGKDVDAVSGATITSTAVVDALNSLAAAPAEEATATEEPAAAVTGEEKSATAQGFLGDVTVKATLDGNTVTALTVETPDETPGLGQNCSEEDFTKQFIGKTLPVELGKDVDAVSGATITSTAVVDALNSLAAAPEAEATPEAEVPENLQTATLTGFGGDVTVKAVLEDNVVVSLTVETPDETAGLGQKCSEEEFTSQFIGKTLPVKLGEDVDAVSGATITSTVVVDALNSLAVLPEVEATATPEPRATREPAKKAAYTKDAPKAQTGDFTVVGKGFGGDVTVKVTLDAGKVVTLAVEADDETAGLGQKCADEEFTSQFIGKVLPVKLGEDVDAVSGATITSTVVVEALNGLTK